MLMETDSESVISIASTGPESAGGLATRFYPELELKFSSSSDKIIKMNDVKQRLFPAQWSQQKKT